MPTLLASYDEIGLSPDYRSGVPDFDTCAICGERYQQTETCAYCGQAVCRNCCEDYGLGVQCRDCGGDC